MAPVCRAQVFENDKTAHTRYEMRYHSSDSAILQQHSMVARSGCDVVVPARERVLCGDAACLLWLMKLTMANRMPVAH
jgi:hypothetical protein